MSTPPRDPAVEAAQRAWVKFWPDQTNGEFEFSMREPVGAWAAESAREALASVRELHQRGDRCRCCAGWDEMNKPIVRYVCTGCTPGAPHYHHWPCATALLVYTAEELNRG